MPEQPDPIAYNIRVSSPVFAHNVEFMPGHNYRVTPEVYEGSTTDGRVLKDLCIYAQPIYP